MGGDQADRTGRFDLLHALYGDVPIRDIWSERRTVRGWLDVESALAQAQADCGVIERGTADAISAACVLDHIDLDQLWKQAAVVGYPILPLVRMIAGALPPGIDGRVHFGATTQDIMDTALSRQLSDTTSRLLDLLVQLGDALAELTDRHRGTIMAARTHAQQAVPTTFGAKTATFLAEVTRHVDDLCLAGDAIAVVSLFGAGGTSAALGERSAEVRHGLARRLGLRAVDVPWHVSRDRVARLGLAMASVAATCIRFAREVIDLSRTEIGEVAEMNGHHRGASSTMPQKVNPVTSEATIGFGVAATTAAGAVLRAMEAGHERSAGEWQAEWIAIPGMAQACAGAACLSAENAATLQVFPERMKANLMADGGLVMAEAVMMRLAPVLGREHAHDLVYAAADRARTNQSDLLAECASALPPEIQVPMGDLRITPEEYTGEADSLCQHAIDDWKQTRITARPSRKGEECDRR